MDDPRRNRRRAARRDIVATLALAGAIFVSILALPIGQVHESACKAASRLAGHPVACGVSELNISLSTDRKPYFSVSWKPLKLPISL